MYDLEAKYPGYHFANHVGYGTAAHRTALLGLGPCPEHRQSFRPIRELSRQITPATPNISISSRNNCNKSLGDTAEIQVIQYLQNLNHRIITHNYKTKTYEIDIISIYKDKIYFTEVKSHQNSAHGSALEQITNAKLQQIQYAAEQFLSTHPKFQHLQPLLAAAGVEGPNFIVKDWFVIR